MLPESLVIERFEGANQAQRVLRINVKGRAQLARERLQDHSFAAELLADIMEIMHRLTVHSPDNKTRQTPGLAKLRSAGFQPAVSPTSSRRAVPA